jgi:hypothetical protein
MGATHTHGFDCACCRVSFPTLDELVSHACLAVGTAATEAGTAATASGAAATASGAAAATASGTAAATASGTAAATASGTVATAAGIKRPVESLALKEDDRGGSKSESVPHMVVLVQVEGDVRTKPQVGSTARQEPLFVSQAGGQYDFPHRDQGGLGPLDQAVYVSEEVEIETEESLDVIRLELSEADIHFAGSNGQATFAADVAQNLQQSNAEGMNHVVQPSLDRLETIPRRCGVIKEKAAYLQQLREEEKEARRRMETAKETAAPHPTRPDVKSIIERYTKRTSRRSRTERRGEHGKTHSSTVVQAEVTSKESKGGQAKAHYSPSVPAEMTSKEDTSGSERYVCRTKERREREVKAETGQNLLTKRAMVLENPRTFLDVQSVLVEPAEGPISVGTDLCASETVESVPGRRAAKSQPSVISCLECGKDFAKRSSLLFHQGKPLEGSSPVPLLFLKNLLFRKPIIYITFFSYFKLIY